jgi:hypothetical protein
VAPIKIRTVTVKTDIPHLFQQLDREEQQYREKLENDLYHWMDTEIIQAHLSKIKRVRAQHGEASRDQQTDDFAN